MNPCRDVTCYVDVAVPVSVRKPFTYSVCPSLKDRVAVGMRVLVPFGRKLVTGYVAGVMQQAPPGEFKIRSIQDVLDPEPVFSDVLVKTALWVSEYYFAPPGEVFRALLPAGLQVSGTRRVSLKQETCNLILGGLRPEGLNPRAQKLLDVLACEGGMTLKQLSKRSGIRNAFALIESMVAAGLVQIEFSMERPRAAPKEQLGIRPSRPHGATAACLTPSQERLYSAIAGSNELLPLHETVRSARSSLREARSLERRGLVEIAPVQVQRVPADLNHVQPQELPVLTSAQQELVDQLLNLIRSRKAVRSLIHGVTGSGKTEIYLRLVAEVLKSGESALFLVPEIGLTPILSRLVVSRFPDQVSLLHSGMSPGERFDQWSRIRQGKAKVVVGTRSAVFAPLEKLRLIIIDEEQDASYKQDESPRYHAREVAWQRMRRSPGLLVLGSATPSMETYYSAKEAGEIVYYRLSERIEAKPLPEVEIVDMGLEFQRYGKATIVSQTLADKLGKCVRRGEQAIILLNRRGYSRSLLCRSCGHVVTCRDCSVSMTYHQREALLICHYCGREQGTPSVCEVCGGAYMYYVGVGTEQLERIIQSLLPHARVARLDRDTTRRRGSLRSILLGFAERKLDVLVGTQILAKGHDFPDVTLVGVVAADAGLSFPDFRSAERTFQLLVQVSGRAGRGMARGRVVIQSFYPENYVLRFAQKQDYVGFFQKEIEFRRLMGYPPFCKITQILVTHRDPDRAARTAEQIAGALRVSSSCGKAGETVVLGPAPAPIEKLRGRHRVQIMVKSPPEADATGILNECFSDLDRRKISLKHVQVDVDPVSLL